MVPGRPTNLDADDFQAIEEAVMETARGRWFLAEFARRQRSAEMAELRELLQRFEARLPSATPAATAETVVAEIVHEAAAEAPRPPVALPAPPLTLRVQPRQLGLTLAMIEAMPTMERLTLFA